MGPTPDPQRPRFVTPRDPSCRTEGRKIARLSAALGKPFMPHQQLIADRATEYDDDGYQYQTVVVVLPRRAGKTTLTNAVQLYRAMRHARSKVFYTAQTGRDARERFKDFLSDWQESPLSPLGKPRLSAGSEGLVLPNGSSVNVFAPTPTALHGDESIMASVDEFWSLTEEQGNMLLGNIGPTQLVHGRWAQIWLFSTVGTEQSRFMNRIMDIGRAGDDPTMFYCEYSLDESADPHLPDNWEWHPALNHTITMDDLHREHNRQPETEWLRAYMNQRPVHSEPPIIPEWDELSTQLSPPRAGSIALGYEVGIENTFSSIVAAWIDDDGDPNVRVVRQAPGSWWLEESLTQLSRTLNPCAIVADDGGPVRRITADLKRSRKLRVSTLGMSDRSVADLALLAAAHEDRSLRHDGSEALATAVRLARLRTTNGVQTISRDRSAGPVPALIAASVALHAASNRRTAGLSIL